MDTRVYVNEARSAEAPPANAVSRPYRGCEVSRGPYRERSERPFS